MNLGLTLGWGKICITYLFLLVEGEKLLPPLRNGQLSPRSEHREVRRPAALTLAHRMLDAILQRHGLGDCRHVALKLLHGVIVETERS